MTKYAIAIEKLKSIRQEVVPPDGSNPYGINWGGDIVFVSLKEGESLPALDAIVAYSQQHWNNTSSLIKWQDRFYFCGTIPPEYNWKLTELDPTSCKDILRDFPSLGTVHFKRSYFNDKLFTEILIKEAHDFRSDDRQNFVRVVDTLIYILKNFERIKRDRRDIIYLGDNPREQQYYIPIHPADMRKDLKGKGGKSREQEDDEFEQQFYGSLIQEFIFCFEAMKQMGKQKIRECCALLTGVCIDVRTRAFLVEGRKLFDPVGFTSLMGSVISSLEDHPENGNYFFIVAVFLKTNWNKPYEADKPVEGWYCPKAGVVNGDSFQWVKPCLALSDVKPTDNLHQLIRVYKTLVPAFRPIFCGYLRSQEADVLAKLEKVFKEQIAVKESKEKNEEKEILDPQIILDIALQMRNQTLALLSIEAGAKLAELNAEDRTPLEEAAECGSWECVLTIVKRWPTAPEARASYEKVLLLAAKQNEAAAVTDLLETKTEANYCDEVLKYTPFHYAVLNNAVEDKTIEDKVITPSLARQLLIANPSLISFPPPITASDPRAATPTVLMMAAERGEVKQSTFEWLLEQPGQNINRREKDNLTALYLAAKTGQLEKVKALLAKGADRTLGCGTKLPYEIALENGFFEVGFLLLGGGRKNKKNKIKMLHSKKFSGGMRLLHLLAKYGREDIITKISQIPEYKSQIEEKNAAGLTPIQHAAEEGHWNAVECCVDLWPGRVDPNNYGHALLHTAQAAADKNTEMLWALILKLRRAGGTAKWYIVTTQYYALHYIILANRTDIAKEFLEVKSEEKGEAPINQRSDAGITVLSMAARRKEVTLKTFQWLLGQPELKVDALDNKGETALMGAAREGAVEKIHALLEAKATRELENTSEETALELAMKNGHVKAVLRLADEQIRVRDPEFRKATYGVKKDSLLHWVAQQQPDDDAMSLYLILIEAGWNRYATNADGSTATQIAAQRAVERGKWEPVLRFTEAKDPPEVKIDPWVRERDLGEVILIAVEADEWAQVESLVAQGGDINLCKKENGYSALHTMVAHNRLDRVEWLVSKEASINNQYMPPSGPIWPSYLGINSNPTPLIAGAYSLLTDITTFQWLLVNGADPNGYDSKGETSLMVLAALKPQGETEEEQLAEEKLILGKIDALLEFKADPQRKDGYGYTAFTLAAMNENFEVALKLLPHFPNWQALRFDRGNTLIHLLVNSDKPVAFRLLKHLISLEPKLINIPNVNGQTALWLAAYKGDKEKIQLFLSFPDVDLETKTGDGSTPWFAAAAQKHGETRCLLAIELARRVNAFPTTSSAAVIFASGDTVIRQCHASVLAVIPSHQFFNPPSLIIKLSPELHQAYELRRKAELLASIPWERVTELLESLRVTLDNILKRCSATLKPDVKLLTMILTAFTISFRWAVIANQWKIAEQLPCTFLLILADRAPDFLLEFNEKDLESAFADCFFVLEKAIAVNREVADKAYACLKSLHSLLKVTAAGDSLIHFVVRSKNMDWCRILIKVMDREELRKPNRAGETPLFLAAKQGATELIELLLKKLELERSDSKEEVSGKDIRQARAAFLDRVEAKRGTATPPSEGKEEKVLPVFPPKTAPILKRDVLLIQQIDLKQWDVCLALLTFGRCEGAVLEHFLSQIPTSHYTPEQIAILECLFDQEDIQDKDDGDKLLHLAVRRGRVDWVKVLIAGGVNKYVKNRVGLIAIQLACRSKHSNKWEIVSSLIGGPGEKAEEIYNEVLLFVTATQQWGLVDSLLKAGATGTLIYRNNGYSAFHYAIEANEIKVAERLLREAKININFRCEHPSVPNPTPLMVAVEKSSYETLVWMFEQKPKPHIFICDREYKCVQIPRGHNYLARAAKEGRWELVDDLLNLGAPTDDKFEGKTALEHLLSNVPTSHYIPKQIEVLRRLFVYEVPFYSEELTGSTLWDSAMHCGRLEWVKALVAGGVKEEIKRGKATHLFFRALWKIREFEIKKPENEKDLCYKVSSVAMQDWRDDSPFITAHKDLFDHENPAQGIRNFMEALVRYEWEIEGGNKFSLMDVLGHHTPWSPCSSKPFAMPRKGKSRAELMKIPGSRELLLWIDEMFPLPAVTSSFTERLGAVFLPGLYG